MRVGVTNTMNDHDQFYGELPEADQFSAAFSSQWYRPLPKDWIIAATDVVNSTVAIHDGRYKDVTIAGALGTIAVSNLTGGLDFPFVFGGDGMIFLLPAEYRESVLDVLSETIKAVRELSGLELRGGVATARDIYTMGGELFVGRMLVTQRYTQAMLSGTGYEIVDQLLKGRRDGPFEHASESRLESQSVRADFSGFTCRWLDIPSRYGETLSLIVRPHPAAGTRGLEMLQIVSDQLESIVRDSEAGHPLSVHLQRPAGIGAAGVKAEARFAARNDRGLRYVLHLLRIRVEIALVWATISLRLPFRVVGKRVKDIPQDNIDNADVRKFDGTVKMTLSVTPDGRRRIQELLDRREVSQEVLYGLHVSDRAIMTCLIHPNKSDEVHFVDAADGGYAMAASVLKEKLTAI